MEMREEIVRKANEILNKLHLTKQTQKVQSESIVNLSGMDEKMFKIYKIFRYLIINTNLNTKAWEEKRKDIENGLPFKELVIRDVYRCICENRAMCTGLACSMVYLMDKIGVPASHKTIVSPSLDRRSNHEIVVFEHQDKEYISDPTLIKSLIDQGKIKHVSPLYLCYERSLYFSKIRPNWKIVADYENVDIENS